MTGGWCCCPLRLVIEVDLLLRNDLQHNIAHDVHHLGRVSMHGRMGGGRGDREDGCGQGGLGGGCEGAVGRQVVWCLLRYHCSGDMYHVACYDRQ
jgi:hypothetical protein